MSNILIIGGTRFLGTQLIPRLLNAGDNITVFNRGNNYGFQLPPSVGIIRGDRANPRDLSKLSHDQYDYVYDMCCYNVSEASSLLQHISPGAHLIFFSSAAVYKTPRFFPLREDSPLGPWASFGDYGEGKGEAERVFSDFATKHGSKLTIFRPVYLLGVNNYFDRENYYFSRIIAGESILLPGNGKCLIQFGFLDETAEAFAVIPKIQNEQIEALNVAGDEMITLLDFILLCAEIAGRQPHIASINPKDFDLIEEEFYDDLYPFPNLNFVVSNYRIRSIYGVSFTKLEDGLREIYESWVKRWDGKVRKYEREIQILESIKNL